MGESKGFVSMADRFNRLDPAKQKEIEGWYYRDGSKPTNQALESKIRHEDFEREQQTENKRNNTLVFKQRKEEADKRAIQRTLRRGKDFFTRECATISELEITEESKALVRNDVMDLIELVKGWLSAIEQNLLKSEKKAG